MVLGQLIEVMGLAPQPLLSAVAVLALTQLAFRYRLAIRKEEHHTRRFQTAVADTESRHRAAVVAACDRARPGPIPTDAQQG